MRPLILYAFVLCLVLLLVSCSVLSLSSDVKRSNEVKLTILTSWKSNWEPWASEPLQTVPVEGGGVAVIARPDRRKLQIQCFSPMLGLVQDIPLKLEDDEEQPRLVNNHHRFFLFTETELDDDRIRIGMRRIDSGVTSFSPMQEILVSPEDFEKGEFNYRYSPDSSRMFIFAFGEEFVSREASDFRKRYSHCPIAGAIVDLGTLEVDRWIDTINYDGEIEDDMAWKDAVISNAGDPTIVEIVELKKTGYQFRVVALRAGKTQIAVQSYPRRELKVGDDPLAPSQIKAGVLSNGDILAVTRNIDGKQLHSLERIHVDHSTLKADFNTIGRFDEAFVKKLTANEEDELFRSCRLETLLVLEDDSYIPVLQWWYQSFITSRNYQSYDKWYYKTIAVLHFNTDDLLKMVSSIDRDESWTGDHVTLEAGFALHRDGTRLSFLTRERDKKGVMLYEIDLEEPDKPVMATLIADLGDKAYLGLRYSAWSSAEEDLFLFVKEGGFGDDWQLVKVTP